MPVPFPFSGLITPYHILGFGILYVAITIYSMYLLFKNEKPLHCFIWMVFILFMPFIGSGLYLLNYFTSKKSNQPV